MAQKTTKVPKQSRSRRRVEAILTATSKLICRNGVANLTTNHIAAEAEMSVASIYRYFPNKEAILAAIYERYLEEERVTLATNQDGPDRSTLWLQHQEEPDQQERRILGRELHRARRLYAELADLHTKHLAIASEASVLLFREANSPLSDDQVHQLIQFLDDLIASFLEAVTRPGADAQLLNKLHEATMVSAVQYCVPDYPLAAKPSGFVSPEE